MTTTTRNEAAERLRDSFEPHEALWVKGMLDEALAAERRATVERIQSNVRLVLLRHHENQAAVNACDVCAALYRATLSTDAILDEELRTAEAKAAR